MNTPRQIFGAWIALPPPGMPDPTRASTVDPPPARVVVDDVMRCSYFVSHTGVAKTFDTVGTGVRRWFESAHYLAADYVVVE